MRKSDADIICPFIKFFIITLAPKEKGLLVLPNNPLHEYPPIHV
jgi:hypothetical protein